MPSTKTATLNPIEWLVLLVLLSATVALISANHFGYSIAPVIALPLLLILARFPQVGFFIMVFMLPFEAFVTLSDTSRFLTFTKFIGVWIFMVFFFHFIVRKKFPRELESNLWPAMVLFLVVGLASSLTSEYQTVALDNIRKFAAAYTIFALTLFFISFHSLQRSLFRIIVLSTTLSAVLSIAGYFLNLSLFAMDVSAVTLKRGVGGMLDPNVFSAVVVGSFPLLAYWFETSRRLIERIFVLSMFLINLATVVFTYSRGGAVIALITLCLIVFGAMRRFRPRYFGFVALLLVFAITAASTLVPSSYWERQKSLLQRTSDPAIGQRTAYLRVAWNNFKEHPLLGTGVGTFHKVYAKSPYAPAYNDNAADYEREAHNAYIEIIAGTGIIGLGVFLIIIYLALGNFATARQNFIEKQRTEMASLTTAFRLTFIVQLLYFLVLSSNYNKYFWINLAISQILLTHSSKIGPAENREVVPDN